MLIAVTILCATSLIGVVQAMATQVSIPGGGASEYWLHPLPHGLTHGVGANGAVLFADGNTWSASLPNGGSVQLQVYQYANGYYVLGNQSSSPYVVPGDNYSIVSVTLVARFVGGSPPYCQLGYAQDYGTYFTYSAANPHDATPGGWSFAWNITSRQNWTPADLKSPAFVGKIAYSVPAGVTYNLDYIGLRYTWGNGGGGGGGPPPGGGPGGLPWAFGGSWLISTLVLVMGGVGFMGMIICPAAMIKAHKRGTPREESAASFLILEFLFIGMLYAALAAF